MTNEHLFPRCLLERTSDIIDSAKTARMPEKLIGPDLKIKDVCKECNNEKLSELDTYICELYDRHVEHIVEPGKIIDFSYDYDLLSRWLLKTTYNASRAQKPGEATDVLQEYTSFMLGEARRPQNVIIYVLMILPHEKQPPSKSQGQKLEPTFMGAQSSAVNPSNADRLSHHILLLRSYVFYVSILSDNRLERKRQKKRIARKLPEGVHPLPWNRRQQDISASNHDALSFYKQHLNIV